MNCKKRYIPYLVGEALCLGAELALFVAALLSGNVFCIAAAAVASCVCAAAVAWVAFKMLGARSLSDKTNYALSAGGVYED